MSGFEDLSREFLITGASSGLGRSLVQVLAPGRRLLLGGRDRGRLEDAAGQAEALGAVEVRTAALDLSDPEAGVALAGLANDFLGPCPGIVLNAGFSLHGRAHKLDETECARELATNARSVLDFLHAFGPRLRAEGGDLLITASIAGLQGVPEQTGYAAAKAFLLSLGSSLAAEWREHGVRASTYAPGLLDTPFFERAGIPRDRRWARLSPFMDPDRAARDALGLLARGRMLGTSGWRNRLALFASRFLSRRAIGAVTAWTTAP